MQILNVASLLAHYRNNPVDMTIDPSDTMFWVPDKDDDQRVKGYTFVGESGANAILASLSLSKTATVRRVLDYGCGGGRVARHIKAMFPDAKIYFSDLKKENVSFCARQFGGEIAPSDVEFSVPTPPALDLIWVGSVFTHINAEKQRRLFDLLWAGLAKGGTLIGTFHGRHVIDNDIRVIHREKLEKIRQSVKATGFGYESYEIPELGDYGASVNSMANAVSLGEAQPDARLVCYSEVGWAGIQDVAAWCKL